VESTHLLDPGTGSTRAEEKPMRYVVDCRSQPSESNCSLTIAGERDEVIRAAAEHAASVHGHEDNAELREMIASGLEPEGATA
jgi:predicted small metal-binding protein